MALKDIKAKIGATNRTHKVTRAVEAVSAVKMRKTIGTARAGRPYARAALQILARLSGASDLARHPLMQVRTSDVHRNGGHPMSLKIALVVITSDKGLAGALNHTVIRAAVAALADYPVQAVTVYAYGKKGFEYFSRRGRQVPGPGGDKKGEGEGP